MECFALRFMSNLFAAALYQSYRVAIGDGPESKAALIHLYGDDSMTEKTIKGTHVVMVIMAIVLVVMGATVYFSKARESLKAATAVLPLVGAEAPRTRDSLRRVPKQLQPPTKRTPQ